MRRIDHVVIGGNGALFAVEGPLQDARHRLASVDKTQAATQSIDASSRQLQDSEQQPLGAVHQEAPRRRMAVMP
jgi:hypothetical protein